MNAKAACLFCGIEFRLKLSRLRKAQAGVCCCRECLSQARKRRLIKPNPQTSTTFKAGRLRAWKMFPDGPCFICGLPGERHHRDGNSLNNNASNVVMLCRRHHMIIDGRTYKFAALASIGGRTRVAKASRRPDGTFA